MTASSSSAAPASLVSPFYEPLEERREEDDKITGIAHEALRVDEEQGD